jgi:hypothetical protein
MRPIEPSALAHYLAACACAGIDPTEATREEIEQVAKLSIPAAIRRLHERPAPPKGARG